MRIHGIAGSVNFGYNKQLNDTANQKLKNAKGNKELAQTLLDMNNFTNGIEDKLRKAEQAGNTRLIDIYSALFYSIKPVIAEQLDARFPKLNYRQIEADTYKQEIDSRNIKDEFHWLPIIKNALLGGQKLFVVVQQEEFPENIGMTGLQQSEPEEKSKNPAKSHSGLEFVEKFTPDEYSPKGFSSLGGMYEVKEILYDKVIYPLQHPEEAKLDEEEYGKKTPRGELLYGPPGCGKTVLMQALSAESGLPLYKLKIAKAGSKYVNESAINVQKAYDYVVQQAQESGKPVLFAMDEMESMTKQRSGSEHNSEDDKLVSTLLQIIENARGKNVIVLGATNYFDQLDDAIKSRFEDKIYIGLPDEATRKEVLKVLLNSRTKGISLAQNDPELNKVVSLTKGFSNRDLTILTDKAALIARKDNRRDITADDFIIPVNQNQNIKVKESQYKAKEIAKPIGFM